VPGGLFATAVSSSQINLSWEASTDDVGVTGYNIYRDGSFLNSTSTNSFQDTGLSSGTLYIYEVSAYDAAGNESARSNMASALTTDTTPPVIESITATPGMTAAGFPIEIAVVALDNVGISNVSSPGIMFTQGDDEVWTGTVTADSELGVHTVEVTAADAAGNSTTSSTSYTTARAFAVTSNSLLSDLVAACRTKYVFKIFGTVTPVDTDNFDLSDGTRDPVRVHCPNHGLGAGQHVTALGIWDPLAVPPQLVTVLTQINVYP